MVQLLDKIVTKAKYGEEEPTQEETENCLKICAKLLGAVSQSKHGKTLVDSTRPDVDQLAT